MPIKDFYEPFVVCTVVEKNSKKAMYHFVALKNRNNILFKYSVTKKLVFVFEGFAIFTCLTSRINTSEGEASLFRKVMIFIRGRNLER